MVTGSTTDFMTAYDKSISHAISGKAYYGNEKSEGKIEASYRNVNSSAMNSSINARKDGNVQQMVISAEAKLYSYELSSGKIGDFLSEEFKKALEEVKDKKSAIKLISLFGTHYLTQADMGARYQENVFFTSEATSQEVALGQKRASGTSLGFSAEIKKKKEEDAEEEEEEKLNGAEAGFGMEDGWAYETSYGGTQFNYDHVSTGGFR